MAYMRGTYYVYLGSGVHIHVGDVLRPDDELVQSYDVRPDSDEMIAEYDAEAYPGSVQIPLRVMKLLAAKFWLEMSDEEQAEFRAMPELGPYLLRAEKKNQ